MNVSYTPDADFCKSWKILIIYLLFISHIDKTVARVEHVKCHKQIFLFATLWKSFTKSFLSKANADWTRKVMTQ